MPAPQERYKRNYKTISLEEQQVMAGTTITVIGCGGLGGFIIEGLARSGVGTLRLVDFDTFDVSNLNRQLFATEHTIGLSKLEETVHRVQAVNSTVQIEAINAKVIGQALGLFRFIKIRYSENLDRRAFKVIYHGYTSMFLYIFYPQTAYLSRDIDEFRIAWYNSIIQG